ncbi:MAG: pyridoxal phosphate-dependent aminotransferase [Alphaproteobacteria bacterium]
MRYAPLVERIAGKGSRAWDVHFRAVELAEEGRDVIFLSIGDPDFDTPRPIVDTAVDALRAGRTHYTAMEGILPLRRAIAARWSRLTGQNVDPDRVVVMSGAQCALFSSIMCLAGPGDEVVVPEPMYVTYEAVVGATGARLVNVPLKGERGFHLEARDLAAAMTPQSRVVLLNTPHNPTGAVLSREELEGVAEVCRRHDLWLVSDEVYATLTYERPHLSPAVLPGMAARTVVVDSLSKSHAMAGWRLGWAIAPGKLPVHLANFALCMLYGVPPFIQDAAVTAVSRDFEEVKAMRRAFRERRDLVVDRVNRMPLLGCPRPEGSMFLMVDVRSTGVSSAAFAVRLLEEEGLSVLPMDGFGPSGEGYVRWSLSAPLDLLQEACNRLERFVRRLAAEGPRRATGASSATE